MIRDLSLGLPGSISLTILICPALLKPTRTNGRDIWYLVVKIITNEITSTRNANAVKKHLWPLNVSISNSIPNSFRHIVATEMSKRTTNPLLSIIAYFAEKSKSKMTFSKIWLKIRVFLLFIDPLNERIDSSHYLIRTSI